jgi:hypothetical protein
MKQKHKNSFYYGMNKSKCPYYVPIKQTCSNKNMFIYLKKSSKSPICKFKNHQDCLYLKDWVSKHSEELKKSKIEPINPTRSGHWWLR